MGKKKKEISAAKLEKIRHFRVYHTQGQDNIYATSRTEANIQIRDLFREKGMRYPQDKKDVEEVIV